MEKEEETTRELLLPSWQGSGSHGLTIAQRDGGVFVQEVQQDSPAARAGVVQEGDQIVGATIYFDNLQSGEVAQLLSTVGHHTVGLKLHRRGDHSPEPGQAWAHEAVGSQSPEMILSGADEEYQRIYATKIKPRLRPEDGVSGDPGETQSRTITVTRRVTAYTVDVTAPEGAKDIDISSPEFMVKIPRHEVTEISTVDVETWPGKTVIKLPSGPELQGAGTSKVQVTMPGVKVGSPGISVSEKGLDLGGRAAVHIPGGNVPSSLGAGAAEVDSGKVKIPTLKMPKFAVSPGPEGQASGAGLSVSGGSGPGVVIRGNIQAPHLDSSVEGILKSPQVAGPPLEGELGLKRAEPQGSIGVDVSVPQVEGSVMCPSGEVRAPGVHVPKLKGPQFSPGSKAEGAGIDVTLPMGEVTLPGVPGGVGLPEIVPGGLEVKTKGAKMKTPEMIIQKPKISMQDVDLSLRSPRLKGDIKVSAPEVKGDMKGPQVALKGSKVDIEAPDLEGTLTAPKLGGPSGKTGTCRISMADVDLNVAAPRVKGGVDVTLPKVEGKFKVPEVDVKGPKVDVSGPDVEIHGPEWNLKMPTVSIPGVKGDAPHVGVTVPKGNASVSGPKVNVEAPGFHMEGFGGKLKGPDTKLPEVGLKTPKISMPGVDLHAEGTEVKECDATVPKLEAEVQGSKGGVSVPDVGVHGPDWHLKMPKMKMPKFSMPGFKAEGPEVDVNLPKADVDFSGPKVEAGVLGVSLEGPDGRLKEPKFKMPGMNIKAPRVSMLDMDLHLKGPHARGEYDVTVPGVEGEIKVPDVELKTAKVDIDLPGVEAQGPDWHLKMPKMKMPKFSVPGVKAESAEVDMNLPKANMDVSGPKVEVGVPDVNVEVPEGKLKGPKLKMPEMIIKGPKISMPDVDLHVKGPKAKGEYDVTVPKLEGDLKSPKIDVGAPDIDIHGPDWSLKMPKIKMPKFSMPSLKGEGPEGDVNLSKADLDISAPKVDISAPDLSLEGPEGKLKGPKFKMPEMHFKAPKMTLPDVDMDLKGPNVKGNLDMSVPKIEGEMKVPDVDMKGPKVDIKATDVDVQGPDWHLKMPKVKMPKFSMPGFKAEGPEVDVNLPKANIDISAPKVDIDVPDVNIEGPEGKLKGPKFKMPEMNIKAPRISMPDVDLDLKGPEVKDFNVSVPKIEGTFKGPEVDLKGPALDFEGPDAKLRGPNLKMPSLDISAPKVTVPDVDLHLKMPQIGVSDPKLEGGEVNLRGPKVDLEAPNLDVDMQGPGISTEWDDVKNPKFKKPKFGFGAKGPTADIKPSSLDVSMPEAELNVEIPEVGTGGKSKKSKFKMPKLHMSGPKVKAKKQGFDLNTPGGEIDASLKAPDVDISIAGPDAALKVDVKSPRSKKTMFGKMYFPDVEFDIKSPKFKAEASLPSPKMEGSVQAPDLNLSSPGINVEGPDIKVKAPKFTMPGVDVSGLKTEGDLKGPKVQANLEAPGVTIEGPDSKVKAPSFSVSTPQVSMPDVNVNLKGPKIQADVPSVGLEGPDVDLQGPEAKIKFPKFSVPRIGVPAVTMEAGGTEAGVQLPSLKGAPSAPNIRLQGPGVTLVGPGVDLPSMNLSEVSGPDLDLNLKGPSLKGELGASVPSVRVHSPGLALGGGAGKVQMGGDAVKVPGADVGAPDVTLQGPSLQGDLAVSGDIKCPRICTGAPELSVEAPEIGMKLPQMKLPQFGICTPGSDTDVGIKGPQVAGGLKGKGVDMSLKGPQLSAPDVDFNIQGPKVTGSLGAPGEVKGALQGVSIQGLEGNLQAPALPTARGGVDLPGVTVMLPAGQIASPDIRGGLKASGLGLHGAAPEVSVKGPSLCVASPESDVGVSLKGPKVKGGMDMSGGVGAPDISLGEGCLGAKGCGAEWQGPQVSSALSSGLHFSGPKSEGGMNGGELGLSVSGPQGPMQSGSGRVTFPKMKIPKFTSGRELVGREVGVDVAFPTVEASAQAGATGGEWGEAEVKLKKSKIKMPRFTFSKPKGKGSSSGSPEASVSESRGDLKSSKASLGSLEGEAEPEVLSPRGKFSLFKSKKPRPRSGSFSEDREPSAPSTPTGTLEFEGGELSLEGGKAKGKHGKLKFGTFGGLGSKSRGHYEVTGSDEDAGKLQGSGASLASKSRLSSSSSNDSGTKVGIQLPDVELAVSARKE
ncbi:neuroblast differentiation-associated protein AHNAK isoform X3 [Heterocephalus glaber]|uniref:Neuroblast differentiation-associated protein AHNAK isoform X2 n=1 Tax=Heterocephalus glaber TaxID=10181 RepID=A0AAX6SFG1_HETGA|nr:neuroblast differentiation-associated protein AHNAK isoform X2 [Heterocephalus glaber]XP_021107470.1 neuroblast differentiation-associated protein AHNAK isoform X3 [Heterocephalus glaber]